MGNDLEMRPSGRNDTLNVVIVDTYSKSLFVDDDAKEDPSNEEATPTPGCSSTISLPPYFNMLVVPTYLKSTYVFDCLQHLSTTLFLISTTPLSMFHLHHNL